MNKDLSTRTPSAIADEINIIKSQAGAVLSSAFSFARRSVFEIGKRLEEAKSLLPHGEWGKWLKENVDYSESTANNLMRIYREFGDEQIDMLTGTSDAEIFGTLSQSQMVELFSLPKPARREFVEEHREELESGEMSIKAMRDEIAKLRREKDTLKEELDEERHKPAPEPVVQEVIVNQPSEEQMEAERKKIEADLKARFDEEREAIHDEYADRIKELEDARDEAEKDAADAEQLEEKLEKATASHKAEMDKLTAEHNKKLAELEETYKKQIKASSSKGDGDALRIQIALETFRREVRSVTSILQKLKSAGEENKSEALQAQVERAVSNIIAEAGWTV